MKVKTSNEFEYEIEIGYKNTIEILKKQVENQSYFLCIDSRVYLFFKEYLKDVINQASDYLIIEAIEDNKSEKTIKQIHDMLFENNAGRDSNVVAIGGGIVGDVVGLASALYMRGLKFIQIPTTLLSQVDSSIGAKVAINAYDTKNTIGTFYPPSKVIIDLHFLSTLTTRIFKEGLVELIKHGLISDGSIIDSLNKYQYIDELQSDMDGLKKLIMMSLKVKKDIVEQDPLDKYQRHVLNLGHTFAHALELSEGNDLYHGEAVAIGLLVCGKLSNDKVFNEIKDILVKFDCIKDLPKINLEKIIHDKKRTKNSIKEIYLEAIGKCSIREVEIESLVNDFENAYENLQKSVIPCESYFEFSPVKLKGNVKIPPSKSQLHRYLIAAALSNERTILSGVTSIYDDIYVTMDALKAFGMQASFVSESSLIIVEPIKEASKSNIHVHMKESGTSLRLLIPLLLNKNQKVLITGENKLPQRPLDSYLHIFEQHEIEYKMLEEYYLPLELQGNLNPGKFEIGGNVSSQFISGLLFTLPLLDGDSELFITSKLESLPYVLMSLEALEDFGIKIVCNDDYTMFKVMGNQKYQSKKEYIIEQDYSSRCFFEVAKSFEKHDITIDNSIGKTRQGDSIVIDVISNNEVELDLSDVPDTAPIMSIYYAINGGTLKNTQRLKYKESDRLQAICDFLELMKIKVINEDNNLIIEKGNINGGSFDTHHDHRIAMSIIIASTIANSPMRIKEIKSINKSFSTFIEEYEKLGGFVDEK